MGIGCDTNGSVLDANSCQACSGVVLIGLAYPVRQANHPLQPEKRSQDGVLFVVNRDEKNVSIDPAGTVASALESWTATTTASALADSNLKYVSDRQL